MLKSSLAICMLLGQTFASEELFLNDHSVNHMTVKDQVAILAADDADEKVENQPQTVIGGACQYVAGYQIYDLSVLERSLKKKQGIESRQQPLQTGDDVMEETNTAFQYKICQPEWTLKSESDVYMDIGLCANEKGDKSVKGTAFMSMFSSEDDEKITDKTCEYAFGKPKFQGILEPEDADQNIKYKGYSLTYESQQQCTSDAGSKMTYKMNILCDKDADESSFSVGSTEACETVVEYKGKEGCHAFSVDFSKYLNPLSKFLGFFEILIGFIVCFFGSRFILYTFGTLVFIAVNAFIMGLSYNLQILVDAKTFQPNIPVIVGVLLLSCIVSAALAYYSLGFANKYASSLLAAWCGGALVALLLSPITALDGKIKMCLIIIAAIAAFYFGKKVNKQIKSIGTAIIGSFFMMHGLGQYLGGFPPIVGSGVDIKINGKTYDDVTNNLSAAYILYLLGFIFFSGLGSYIQMKFVAHDDFELFGHNDDMMNPKDA